MTTNVAIWLPGFNAYCQAVRMQVVFNGDQSVH